MSDEITVSGKSFISSKRASELTSYSQDYIGQLARSGQISAQRVGGLWYVLLDSLKAHQDGSSLKEVPTDLSTMSAPTTDPDSFVGLDGKKYISASRASKLSGYNQDYVGQLARSGQILARQIGNRWYVEENSVSSHKKEKDALLAAVQSESVGLRKNVVTELQTSAYESESATSLHYFEDKKDLMPVLTEADDAIHVRSDEKSENESDEKISDISIYKAANRIPINRSSGINTAHALVLRPQSLPERYQVRQAYSRIPFVPLAASALTIVIVVSIGFTSVRSQAIYSWIRPASGTTQSTAAAASAFENIVSAVERVLTRELTYARKD